MFQTVMSLPYVLLVICGGEGVQHFVPRQQFSDCARAHSTNTVNLHRHCHKCPSTFIKLPKLTSLHFGVGFNKSF